MKILWLAAFASILLGSCSVEKSERVNELPRIDSVYTLFDLAYRTNDSTLIKQVYAPDHFFLSPSDERLILQGKDHFKLIGGGFRRSVEQNATGGLRFCFIDRKIENDYAFDIGYYKGYKVLTGQDTIFFYGKFQNILKKQANKSWQIYSECYQDLSKELYLKVCNK